VAQERERAIRERRPQAGAAAENATLDALGIPSAANIKEDITKAMAEIDEARRRSEDRAYEAGQRQLLLVKSIEQQWRLIVQHMSLNIMESDLGRGLKWISDLLAGWNERFRREHEAPVGRPGFGFDPQNVRREQYIRGDIAGMVPFSINEIRDWVGRKLQDR
jgi:hypothetical protein